MFFNRIFFFFLFIMIAFNTYSQNKKRKDFKLIHQLFNLSYMQFELNYLSKKIIKSLQEELKENFIENNQKLNATIQKGFASSILYEDAIKKFQDYFEEEKIKEVIKLLKQPILNKMIQFQKKKRIKKKSKDSITEKVLPEFPLTDENFLFKERLEEAKKIKDFISELNLLLSSGILSSLQLALYQTNENEIVSLYSQLELKTEIISEELYIKENIDFILSSEKIRSDELERYIEFLESDLGIWYQTIIYEVIKESFYFAGLKWGDEIVKKILEHNKEKKEDS